MNWRIGRDIWLPKTAYVTVLQQVWVYGQARGMWPECSDVLSKGI